MYVQAVCSLCQLERIDSLFCFPNFASYFHDRMLINLLSELNLGSQHRMVQVYASRLWHHRGGTDDGRLGSLRLMTKGTTNIVYHCFDRLEKVVKEVSVLVDGYDAYK